MTLAHAWLLLLRLIHVVGGALWLGSMFTMARFVLPTQAAEGAEGGRFVQRMVTERGFSRWMNDIGGLAILSGLVLYGQAAWGTRGAFARSHAGIVFGIGALFAIAAMGVGNAMGGASARRIGALRARLAAEGRGPTAEEGAEFGRLAARGARGARISAGLLLLAAIAMAVARYS